MPKTDIALRIMRSYHPHVSADIIYIPEAFSNSADYMLGATHGTPYNYDTTVPILIAGSTVAPGRHTQRASTLDIAPTIAHTLGILAPSGSEGRILPVTNDDHE